MNIILGINFGHPDSSACLVIEGDLIGAVSEERFGERIKNTSNFPSESVKWLLQSNNINLKDITHVAIGRNPQSNFIAKVKYVLSNPNNSYKAVDLAVGATLGNPNLINDDFNNFKSISGSDILTEAKKIFCRSNCTSLYYGKM